MSLATRCTSCGTVFRVVQDQLKVSELPGAWNAKYREYLGIESPTDSDGVLQDVHWYAGQPYW